MVEDLHKDQTMLDRKEYVALPTTLTVVVVEDFHNELDSMVAVVVHILSLDENSDRVMLVVKSHRHSKQMSDNLYYSQYIVNIFHYSDSSSVTEEVNVYGTDQSG
jgi:hypothetical protein